MKKRIQIIVIVLLMMSQFSGFSQEILTQYSMKSLSENNFMNPGRMPETRLNISLPVLSSTSIGYSNSGFAVSDLITKKPKTDSMEFNTSNMLSKLSDNNYLNMSLNTEILGFGFKVKRNYYSFNARFRNDINLSYSKAMLTFLFNGNNAFLGRKADLSMQLNATSYTEYALGFIHNFKNDKLTIGGNLKLLSGNANVNMKRANLGIYTDSNTYSITATPDVLINSSAIDTGSKTTIGLLGENTGLGIDVGFSYKISDKLNVSGSIVDLGFINWKANVVNYQTNTTQSNFTFSGFDVNKMGSSLSPYIDSLSDSLKHVFDPKKTTNSYKTGLGTKIYAGVNYKLAKGLDAGLLLFGRFVNDKFYSAVTVSLNEELNHILNVSTSFSRVNKTNNIGFGVSLNLLPVQIYMVTDNIFSLNRVDEVRNTNLHFGINLAIGRIEKRGI